MDIDCVPAQAGGGKTRSLLKHAGNLISKGKPTLFVQPTIALSTQSQSDFEAMFNGELGSILINNVTHRKKATKTLLKFLHNPEKNSKVAFITNANFENIRNFPDQHEWNYIQDEIPQFIGGSEINLKKSYNLIMDNIHLSNYDQLYYELICMNDEEFLELIRSGEVDGPYSTLREIASRIYSDKWSYFMKKERYEKLIDPTTNTNKFFGFGYMDYEWMRGFSSVTLAGANFEDRLLVKQLRKDATVNMRDADHIIPDLRYQEHKNGHLLRICYATHHKWTMDLYQTENNYQRVVDCFAKRIGNNPFIWSANKKHKHDHFKNSDAERVEGSPHGLNKYMHYNYCCILQAQNLKTEYRKFVTKALGFSEDEVRAEVYYEAVYQMLCRTSIRDPNATNKVVVCVPSYDCAVWLQSKFPGAVLEDLKCELVSKCEVRKPGRPSGGFESKANYMRHYRQRLKEKASTSV